jgi:hypothetical protein
VGIILDDEFLAVQQRKNHRDCDGRGVIERMKKRSREENPFFHFQRFILNIPLVVNSSIRSTLLALIFTYGRKRNKKGRKTRSKTFIRLISWLRIEMRANLTIIYE